MEHFAVRVGSRGRADGIAAIASADQVKAATIVKFAGRIHFAVLKCVVLKSRLEDSGIRDRQAESFDL